MDFRSLNYFRVVAEELNFTRAAERLNMSQPPLSLQIRTLEEELGVPLFIRGKRKLALTPEGLLLKRRTDQLLAFSEKTKRELREMKDELAGTLHLGLVEGRAPYLASRWIRDFRKKYPLVDYSLSNGSSDDVLEMLTRGFIDLAVIAAPYDEEHLEGVVAGREPWVAMIPRDHRLAGEPDAPIRLADLREEPLIIPQRPSRAEAILRYLRETGGEPKVLCRLSSYVDACALVEEKAGICIFPQTTYTPNPHFVTRVITEPDKQAAYVLVWYKHQPPRGLAAEFVRFVRELMKSDEECCRASVF